MREKRGLQWGLMPNSHLKEGRTAGEKGKRGGRGASLGKRKRKGRLAAEADRYDLYERAVQCPEAEVAFIERVFRRKHGRLPTRLREDFCGTGYLACEWVKHRNGNEALGLDLDPVPLAWGEARHRAGLSEEARRRVRLVRCDVMEAPAEAFEVVAALNFSYWVFQDRGTLRRYFERVRRGLSRGGMLVIDLMGGADAHLEVVERTRIGGVRGKPGVRGVKGENGGKGSGAAGARPGFTYVWEHKAFEPVTGKTECRIHFEFEDGSKVRSAFTYKWRLWTIPELRELMEEAGFEGVTAYWEGEDARGKGNGVFRPSAKGTADRSFVAYVVAWRGGEGGEG
jgi:hypothetical protein